MKCGSVIRPQTNGLSEVLNGMAMIALVLVGDSSIIEPQGIAGIQPECLAIVLHGALVITGALIGNGAVKE